MQAPARILIADDNHALLAILRTNLARDFHVVGSVDNGLSLLEAAERLQPDVIVTDISMPGLNGLEAVRQLQRKNPPGIVFFTVHDELAFQEEARAVGATGYVLKSSRPEILVNAIRAAAQLSAAAALAPPSTI